ncbi:uncharacterized protein LOC121789608 isoform X2 [Salvia splendens]|uniref:uncharacterized protein LOC121789608 isoform X2 n=1 Tax=Salvia splendens TaxID=180675 RepID=UPI001C25BC62|nr:uncharacterized protein LOC121789608 isoform X2 [Salvia splendens]XP_042043962.1 uncharacterized protein LOC121789608 isoform X2 [Salvia splendens]XP_042043963.1 uncharacterized protein LOC121789608 isoform X2 [Salvia splendens]
MLMKACERLILLKHNPKELRDYAVLLYHCGYYEEALFLKHYQNTKQQTGSDTNVEEEAVKKLVVRLNLILMGVGWSKQQEHRNILFKNFEPCLQIISSQIIFAIFQRSDYFYMAKDKPKNVIKLILCSGLGPKELVQKW